MKRFSKRSELSLPSHPIVALPDPGGHVRLEQATGGQPQATRGSSALRVERVQAKSGAEYSLILGQRSHRQAPKRDSAMTRMWQTSRVLAERVRSVLGTQIYPFPPKPGKIATAVSKG